MLAEALQFCLKGEAAFFPHSADGGLDDDNGDAAEAAADEPLTMHANHAAFPKSESNRPVRSAALPTPPAYPAPPRTAPGVNQRGRPYVHEPAFEVELAPDYGFVNTARPIQSR